MKLKHLALAALAAVAAGQAMAQVTNSTSTSTLEFFAADASQSYVFNTGISLAALAAGTVTQTFQLPTNWNYALFTNGVYGTTTSSGLNTTGVQWGLYGASSNITVGKDAEVVSGTGLPATSYTNSQLINDAKAAGGATGLNTFTTNQFVANGTTGYVDPGLVFAWGGYGSQLEGTGLTAGLNSGVSLYSEAVTPKIAGGTAYTGTAQATIFQPVETVTFDATAGTLTITGTAAAVPEPSRLALMLAGLSAVFFVARRRSV